MEINASSSTEDDLIPSIETVETKPGRNRPYAYRWLILTLYSIISFSNILIVVSFYTVSDVTAAYFGVTVGELLWSTTASAIIHLILVVPFTSIPSRLGLRTTILLGAALTALGASVIIISMHRNGFLIFVLGQVINALGSAFLPQLSPEISAVWFGEKEQALSTSIGIGSVSAGVAFSFAIPALMIGNIDPQKNIEFIGEKLRELVYSQAALCTSILFLNLLFFKNSPPSPPTLSQSVRNKDTGHTLNYFKNTYKSLLKDKNYLLCLNSIAINAALGLILPLVLNGIISWRFPHQDATIGWLGFAAIMGGIIGCIIFAIVVDKTKKHKIVVYILGAFSISCWLCFTEILVYWNNVPLPLVCTMFILATFTFLPIGPILVDMLSEMTYPISESMSFVPTLTLGGLYSLPLRFAFGYLMDRNEYHAVCLTIAVLNTLTIVFVIFLKVERKRSEAGEISSNGQLTNSTESLIQVPDEDDLRSA